MYMFLRALTIIKWYLQSEHICSSQREFHTRTLLILLKRFLYSKIGCQEIINFVKSFFAVIKDTYTTPQHTQQSTHNTRAQLTHILTPTDTEIADSIRHEV